MQPMQFVAAVNWQLAAHSRRMINLQPVRVRAVPQANVAGAGQFGRPPLCIWSGWGMKG